jgi:hypothetical protein
VCSAGKCEEQSCAKNWADCSGGKPCCDSDSICEGASITCRRYQQTSAQCAPEGSDCSEAVGCCEGLGLLCTSGTCKAQSGCAHRGEACTTQLGCCSAEGEALTCQSGSCKPLKKCSAPNGKCSEAVSCCVGGNAACIDGICKAASGACAIPGASCTEGGASCCPGFSCKLGECASDARSLESAMATSTSRRSRTERKLGKGAIAGLAVAGFLLIPLVIAISAFIMQRRKRRASPKNVAYFSEGKLMPNSSSRPISWTGQGTKYHQGTKHHQDVHPPVRSSQLDVQPSLS